MFYIKNLFLIFLALFTGLGSSKLFAQPLSSLNSTDQQLQQIAMLQQMEENSKAPARSSSDSKQSKKEADTKQSNSEQTYQPPMLTTGKTKQQTVSREDMLRDVESVPPEERPTSIELNAPFKEQLPIRAEQEEKINQLAFEEVIKDLLPLTPEQIHRLRQMYDLSQYAASAPAGVPPKPTVTTRFVKLDPGSTAPVIRLAAGFVTTVAFLDSTGAPWPIEAYSLGKPSDVDIIWNQKDNIMFMQASELYTHGNMAVKLRGLNTPVMLTLASGQKALDYRIDLRVEGFGPEATPPVVSTLPATENAELLDVLDRIPPTGSKTLKIKGGPGEAWLKGDRLFLRTRLTVLSPGWLATMSSADGMNAYELNKTSTILASHNGKTVQLKVEGL